MLTILYGREAGRKNVFWIVLSRCSIVLCEYTISCRIQALSWIDVNVLLKYTTIHYINKKVPNVGQNGVFHVFWLSILKCVLTLGPYVFGSVERMLWSVFCPNIVVRYLITTNPPSHLGFSYFGRKFGRFLKFNTDLVNTEVNKINVD